jgi:hypothetical protein
MNNRLDALVIQIKSHDNDQRAFHEFNDLNNLRTYYLRNLDIVRQNVDEIAFEYSYNIDASTELKEQQIKAYYDEKYAEELNKANNLIRSLNVHPLYLPKEEILTNITLTGSQLPRRELQLHFYDKNDPVLEQKINYNNALEKFAVSYDGPETNEQKERELAIA